MKFLILLSVVLFSASSFAGGSASQSLIRKLGAGPATHFMVSNFLLEEQGQCTRMGRNTELGGERVLPCVIHGKMRLNSKPNRYRIEIGEDGQIFSVVRVTTKRSKVRE